MAWNAPDGPGQHHSLTAVPCFVTCGKEWAIPLRASYWRDLVKPCASPVPAGWRRSSCPASSWCAAAEQSSPKRVPLQIRVSKSLRSLTSKAELALSACGDLGLVIFGIPETRDRTGCAIKNEPKNSCSWLLVPVSTPSRVFPGNVSAK